MRHALICVPLVPEIDRQGGSRRSFHFVEFLLEAGWTVTLAAEQPVAASATYVEMLESRGVRVASSLDAASLHPLLANHAFELAILTGWPIAERCLPALRLHAAGSFVLIDTVDLHFIRGARLGFLETGSGGSPPILGWQFGLDMVRELNVYAAADGVLTVSSEEGALLTKLMGPAVHTTVAPDSEALRPSAIPMADRRGVLFLGNFAYAANTDALAFLCKEVLPQVDAALLARHPLTILGNGFDDRLRAQVGVPPGSRTVGWVPTLEPFLHETRVFVAPLRYGAGTKRKVIEALMAGCATVCTPVATEGLGLVGEVHCLIGEDAASFTHQLSRLLMDVELCARLGAAGQRQIAVSHGRPGAKEAFLRAVDDALSRAPKGLPPPGTPLQLGRPGAGLPYEALVDRVREVACTVLPARATVLVVSRGDDRLLQLEGRRAWHFPRADVGGYAGWYPATGEEAVRHLEALRNAGAEFLLFPGTALWWLDHYVVFKQHLERNYAAVARQDDLWLILDLRGKEIAP